MWKCCTASVSNLGGIWCLSCPNYNPFFKSQHLGFFHHGPQPVRAPDQLLENFCCGHDSRSEKRRVGERTAKRENYLHLQLKKQKNIRHFAKTLRRFVLEVDGSGMWSLNSLRSSITGVGTARVAPWSLIKNVRKWKNMGHIMFVLIWLRDKHS